MERNAWNAGKTGNVTFQGMLGNIPGKFLKHSGECPQTFQVMLPNIPGNVLNEDFILLLLCFVLIERITRQGVSKIPLCNPSGAKLPVRPSSTYNKLSGRIAVRIFPNIHGGFLLRK